MASKKKDYRFNQNKKKDSRMTGNSLKPFFGLLKDDPIMTLVTLESNRQEIAQKLRNRFK